MKFYSKAKTLKKIKLKQVNIPKLIIFKVRDYKRNKSKILNQIKSTFKKKIAIRSSSLNEDSEYSSNAGKYKSFLSINSQNKNHVNEKIVEVIKSYKKISNNDEFFIQEMVEDIKIAGVLLSRNLNDYSKCININFSIDKKSSTVTSGKGNSKTIIYYENKEFKIPKKFQRLYEITKKLEYLFNDDLDIEFIIDKNNKVFILQVRKLVIPKNVIISKNNINKSLEGLKKKIDKLKKRHYSLNGRTTHFGVMPDWNPAEMIGIKPKPLALSLYQELITDHVWAENRKLYGYKDLGQFHLMTTFFGTPFIDVRIDFNSWIPEKINKQVSEKIVNFYLDKFKDNNEFHDKVEFEILFTSYNLSTEKKLNNQLKNILNKKEINNFINNLKKINKVALIQSKKDFHLVKQLEQRQQKILKSNLYYIDKIYWLIEDCKKFGTLPFAGLARCAFISTEILNSFVDEKIISNDEKLIFLSTIKTITSEMNNDLKNISKKMFIKKYGHLRPGTYEITSENYKSNFDLYFGKKKENFKIEKKIFKFSKIQKAKIENFIKKSKIYSNFDELINFIKNSIRFREFSKFIFSRSIDLIFENLEKFGNKYNINKKELSYIDIQKILVMYYNYSNLKSIDNLKENILQNKIEYHKNLKINLPDIITDGKDLFIQKSQKTKINFISNKIISSKIIEFNKADLRKKLNSIVCIENADPGFDFLFSKNIKGLVTKYGGQNSHMAIRCAELNLPALIGVGEENYSIIKNSQHIKIDCVQNKIEIIK
jgi:phosphohistidine swiveling domain-containing protein